MSDIAFEGWRAPPGFISDGCTLPGPLKLLRGFMRAADMRAACVLHDFLRRYAIVKASDADKILRRNLAELGLPAWKARLYWVFVKVSRPWYAQTVPLPAKWAEYAMRVSP